MKRLLVLLLVLVAAGLGSLSCQSPIPRRDPTGERFPSVQGESLEKQAVLLPEELAGEPAVLLVGYVQDAQFDADRWILGLLQAEASLRILEVPTIAALVPTMIRGTIDNGMRSGIPSEDWSTVVTVYGQQARAIQEFTGTERTRNMRVLLLDGEGQVVWFHDEGYSARELLEMLEAAQQLQPAGSPSAASAAE